VGTEASLSGSLAHKVNGLVHSTERRHVDSLSSHSTSGTDSGGVFSGTALDDGLEEDFERVASSEEVDDLESLSEDSDSHLLFTILSMHSDHEHTDDSLRNGARHLSESLLLILSSSVWDVHLGLGGLH